MNQIVKSHPLIIASILSLLGITLNSLFTIPLYANLVLHMGAVCTMIGLFLLGTRWGVAIAFFVTLPLSYNWDNWAIMLLALLEAAVAGWLISRRWFIIYADLGYWIVFGMPLTFALFITMYPAAADFAVSTALKQGINGLLYTTTASLIVPFLKPEWRHTGQDKAPPSMRSIVQRNMLTLIVATATLVGMISAESAARKHEDLLRNSMNWQAHETALIAENYLRFHKQAIQSMANIFSNVALSDNQKSESLKLLQSSYPGFISMLVSDLDGQVKYAAPEKFDQLLKNELGTVNVSDRDYFIEALANEGEVFVSEVFKGKGFGQDVIVAISTAFTNSANVPEKGIVEGSLDLNYLANIYSQSAVNEDSMIVILDGNERTLYASDALELPTLATFTITEPKDNYNTDLEMANILVGNSERDMYYQIKTLENGWQVYIMQPPTELVTEFQNYYFLIFLMVALSSAVSGLISSRIAHEITGPIERIIEFFSKTPDLPLKNLQLSRNVSQETQYLVKVLYKAQRLQQNFSNRLRRTVDQQTSELKKANEKLQELAHNDELTGLANRRTFNDHFNRMFAQAVRLECPLTVAVIDADHFKRINDSHGHLGGDQCLVALSAIIDESFQRESDLKCRFGGEEFVVALLGYSIDESLRHLERFRQKVEAHVVTTESERSIHFTVSIGVSSCTPVSPLTAEKMLQRADEQLYRSKQNGRNQINLVQGALLDDEQQSEQKPQTETTKEQEPESAK